MLFHGRFRIPSARLPGHDYDDGYYHVVICTHDRAPWFGRVEAGRLLHSRLGGYAHLRCEALSARPAVTEVPAFIVMPDHVHLVLGIQRDSAAGRAHARGAGDERAIDQAMSERSPRAGTLGAIVRTYKADVTYWARQNGYAGFGWQSRYYDRVIRSERELADTCRYVIANPERTGGRA